MTQIKWWTDDWYPMLTMREAELDDQPSKWIKETRKPSPKTGAMAVWRKPYCDIIEIPDDLWDRYTALNEEWFEVRGLIWDIIEAKAGPFRQIRKADLEEEMNAEDRR